MTNSNAPKAAASLLRVSRQAARNSSIVLEKWRKIWKAWCNKYSVPNIVYCVYMRM